MSKQGIVQLFRPAHKVPDTVWSSETPLNLKPRFITLFFLVLGLWIFGTGEAILIGAGIGVSPWTVLAQGITEQTGFTVGISTFIVGVLVLLFWIPLRELPGIGTILNIILISMAIIIMTVLTYLKTIDVMNPYIPEQTEMIPAIFQAGIGIIFVGIGSAFYLTANLGPGPRDGWMTGIQKRTDWPISRVRIGIEILGGNFGIGTIMFALGIGPIVAVCLGIVARWTKL